MLSNSNKCEHESFLNFYSVSRLIESKTGKTIYVVAEIIVKTSKLVIAKVAAPILRSSKILDHAC
jgi:hypothetical protein